MTEGDNWVTADFSADPHVRGGYLGETPSDSDKLSPLETTAVLHLLQTAKIYKHFCRGFLLDIYPVGATDTVAKILISSRRRRAAVVISLGLIRLIIALAARVSIRMTGGKGPYGLFSNEMSMFREVGSPSDDSINQFQMSTEKRNAAGLNEKEIKESIATISCASTLALIEYTAAALEFIALLELSHAVLRHREAGVVSDLTQNLLDALPRGEEEDTRDELYPKLRLDRAFEHQADYAAIHAMWIRAPLRPSIPSQSLKHLYSMTMSKRYLGVAGAGVALAAIALLQAPEPTKELHVRMSPTRGHPAAISRIPVAVSLFIGSFVGHPFRRAAFGLLAKDYANLLNRLQFAVNINAMCALSKDWRTIGQEGLGELPAWINVIFESSQCTDFITPELWKDLQHAQYLSGLARSGWHIDFAAK